MAKEKHQHTFKRIGGGCLTGDAANGKSHQKMLPELIRPPCDDHYRCSCGLEFIIYTKPEVHFTLPTQITGRN